MTAMSQPPLPVTPDELQTLRDQAMAKVLETISPMRDRLSRLRKLEAMSRRASRNDEFVLHAVVLEVAAMETTEGTRGRRRPTGHGVRRTVASHQGSTR